MAPDHFSVLSLYLELSRLALQLLSAACLHAVCVCTLGHTGSGKSSNSPQIKVGESLLETKVPCSGKRKISKAAISVWTLSCYWSHAQGIFPLTYKICLLMVHGIFCTPWLQNFISAKIPLIVQVDYGRIAENPG